MWKLCLGGVIALWRKWKAPGLPNHRAPQECGSNRECGGSASPRSCSSSSCCSPQRAFSFTDACNLLHHWRSERLPASLLTMVCKSALHGHQTDASLPTVPTAEASSTFGCSRLVAATPCRSPKDQVTTGSPIGRLMAISLRIVPKTARVACLSYLRSAVKDWKGESHLSDITLDGPQTARRSCSKPHHLL